MNKIEDLKIENGKVYGWLNGPDGATRWYQVGDTYSDVTDMYGNYVGKVCDLAAKGGLYVSSVTGGIILA